MSNCHLFQNAWAPSLSLCVTCGPSAECGAPSGDNGPLFFPHPIFPFFLRLSHNGHTYHTIHSLTPCTPFLLASVKKKKKNLHRPRQQNRNKLMSTSCASLPAPPPELSQWIDRRMDKCKGKKTYEPQMCKAYCGNKVTPYEIMGNGQPGE